MHHFSGRSDTQTTNARTCESAARAVFDSSIQDRNIVLKPSLYFSTGNTRDCTWLRIFSRYRTELYHYLHTKWICLAREQQKYESRLLCRACSFGLRHGNGTGVASWIDENCKSFRVKPAGAIVSTRDHVLTVLLCLLQLDGAKKEVCEPNYHICFNAFTKKYTPCCDGLSCKRKDSRGLGDFRCCAAEYQPCEKSSDCCDMFECHDKTCQKPWFVSIPYQPNQKDGVDLKGAPAEIVNESP